MTMRLHRSIVPVLVALAFVAVLFVGVFPTRTYLAQRDEMAQSRDRLSELDTANVEAVTTPDNKGALAFHASRRVHERRSPHAVSRSVLAG